MSIKGTIIIISLSLYRTILAISSKSYLLDILSVKPPIHAKAFSSSRKNLRALFANSLTPPCAFRTFDNANKNTFVYPHSKAAEGVAGTKWAHAA